MRPLVPGAWPRRRPPSETLELQSPELETIAKRIDSLHTMLLMIWLAVCLFTGAAIVCGHTLGRIADALERAHPPAAEAGE